MSDVSIAVPQAREFTISRATWLRGKGSMASMLLVPETGKMCCLGSVAKQCGATDEQIGNITSPARLAEKQKVILPGFTDLLVDRTDPSNLTNSNVAEELMTMNDSRDISDETREAELKYLAASIGWTFTFID